VGLIRFREHPTKGGYRGKDGNQEQGTEAQAQLHWEFKEGAVRLVLDERKSVAETARNLDVSESVLRNWLNQAMADRTHGKTGLTTEERAELARLRRENRVLRMERDILKKAAAFFARENT
jgi:transposase